MDKVAVGCIVRNRAWILPDYLEALRQIVYPDKLYLFLENNSLDSTKEILRQVPLDAPKIVLSVITNAPHWERYARSLDQFANMATVRNRFIDLFLSTDAKYLLSVDSDIIVPPDIILRLISDDTNLITAATISNVPNTKPDGKNPGNFMINRNGIFFHPPHYPLTGSTDVDLVGAVYLIPRQVFTDGVRYAPHPQGEDVPFCLQAKAKGYRMRVILDLICDHRMVQQQPPSKGGPDS